MDQNRSQFRRIDNRIDPKFSFTSNFLKELLSIKISDSLTRNFNCKLKCYFSAKYFLYLENAAPVFAGRSLDALKSPGAPLHGLKASQHYVPFDWREAKRLGDLLRGMELDRRIVVVMAEGGLFDYGTDDEISFNLKILHTFTPEEMVMAATFTPKYSGTFTHIGSPRIIA